MCTFENKLSGSKSVVGYKLAFRDKYGHYYSPITGVRYEVGKVNAAKKYGKHNIREILQFRDILNPDEVCHQPRYTGKTAIFKNITEAISFRQRQIQDLTDYSIIKNLVILEMELSGELYFGSYICDPVYIGSEIKSIMKVNV